MAYTETTTKSYGSKLKDSLKGVLIGIVMIAVSPILLCWNESNYVKTKAAIEEFSGSYKSISDVASLSTELNGKPVYLTGDCKSDERLTDPELGITVSALKLERNAEMFQWKEIVTEKEEKQTGGSSKITKEYKYEKVWSEKIIDSNSFNQNAVADYNSKNNVKIFNPAVMPVVSARFLVKKAYVGAYTLSTPLIEKISNEEPLNMGPEVLSGIKAELQPYAKVNKNIIFIGENPAAPQIGDTKINMQVINFQALSVLGKLEGSVINPFISKSNRSIARVEMGTIGSDLMIQNEQSENVMITWILRLVGFLLMFFGISMLFGPISKLAEVLPFLSSIIGFGANLIAFIIAFPVCLIIIAIAWIAVRPILAISLLVIGIGGAGGLIYYKKKIAKKPA